MTVWLVWDGEWEATLESIHETESGARKAAHDIRERNHFDKRCVVTVEEREVKS